MRRIVSSTLAFAMTLSLFSEAGFSGVAQAAQELTSHADEPAARQGKPTLYIDFLGDNSTLFTTPGIAVPGERDWSIDQHPTDGIWNKYSQDSEVGTIFWVGVGIDKMTLFELAKEGKGLSGLELGFYYNSEFVVPYVGGSVDGTTVGTYNCDDPAGYKQVLSENIATTNSINRWSGSNYAIREAIPKMEQVIDPDTQTTIVVRDPESGEAKIVDIPESWDMLYVSLEKIANLGESVSNRFADAVEEDDENTNYVMMFPFVLKAIDPNAEVCFRLARNAAVFSMGGGTYGAGTYDDDNSTSSFGAWEGTTRTPGHNLMEMFSFEGDLNIFTGRNEGEVTYKATLDLPNSSAANNAILSDPFGNSVSGATPVGSREITGLPNGVKMTLDITADSSVQGIVIEIKPLHPETTGTVDRKSVV